jgi:hypothetical protein
MRGGNPLTQSRRRLGRRCLYVPLLFILGVLVAYALYVKSKMDRIKTTSGSAVEVESQLFQPGKTRRVNVLDETYMKQGAIAPTALKSFDQVAAALRKSSSFKISSDSVPVVNIAQGDAVLVAPAQLSPVSVDNTTRAGPGPVITLANVTVPVMSWTGSKRPKALIFTMDSIQDYVKNAKGGGPAGEIIIRESLQWGLRMLGIEYDVAESDDAFARLSQNAAQYDLYFLDPWTTFGPGWKPRSFLPGRESKTFILSFFGMHEAGHDFKLDTRHILTPYPTNAFNTFLGYAMDQRWVDRKSTAVTVPVGPGRIPPQVQPRRKRQGVVWGKKPSYFAGKEDLLRKLAETIELHTTCVEPLNIPNIVNHGHLTRDEWHKLLAESRFMLGLGELEVMIMIDHN